MPAKTEDARDALSAFLQLWYLANISPQPLPQGEGEKLGQGALFKLSQTRDSRARSGADTAVEWRQLMATMIELDEPRAALIARYLAKHFQSKPELSPQTDSRSC